MITHKRALAFITATRNVQQALHQDDQHTLIEWITIMRRQLQKAEDLWYRGRLTDSLQRIGHAAAVGVAALQQLAIDEGTTISSQ